MADKAAAEKDQELSSFAIVRGFVERFAKGLAIYTGTVYFIGYLVTAARLARYGVASIELIDAQYVAAGLLPGLLLWTTVLALVSASRYDPRKEDGGWKAGWIWANVLFSVSVGAIPALNSALGERFDAVWDSLYPQAVPLVLLVGELGLWILIVGFKGRVFLSRFRLSKKPIQVLPTIVRLGYVLYLVFFALLLVVLAPSSGVDFYEELPQAYGGGKPLTVRLYVDRENVPAELLDADADSDQDSLARTVSLNLVFQTSTEYVVDPTGDGGLQAWVLKADAVHAIVSE